MLTNKELKKALEKLAEYTGFTDYNKKLLQNTLDYINRLESENEKLERENKNLLLKLCKKVSKESKVIENHIKAEAYKEVVERLHTAFNVDWLSPEYANNTVDNLYKELMSKSAE